MAGRRAPRPSQLSLPERRDNPSEFVNNQVHSEGRGRRPTKENHALDSLRLTLHANAIKAAKAKETRMKNAQLRSQPMDKPTSTPQWETPQNVVTRPPSHAVAQSNPNSHYPFSGPKEPSFNYPFTGPTEQSFMEQLTGDDLTWPGAVTTLVHRPAMPASPWTPAQPMTALSTPVPVSMHPHGMTPTTTPTAAPPSQEFNFNAVPSTPTPRAPLAPLNYAPLQPQQHQSVAIDLLPSTLTARPLTPALIPFEDDDPEYREDAWVQQPVDGHQHESENEEDHLEKGTDDASRRGLQITMCSVEPKSVKKRKRAQRKKDRAARRAQSDTSEDGDSDHQVHRKKKKSRSIKTFDEETQSILSVAYELCKQKLTLENPWPNDPKSDILAEDQLDEATEIAMHAWLEAWEKLELEEEREPGMDELQHICGRISQFRGQLRDHARIEVIEEYGFVNPKRINNPTPENLEAVRERNRALVASIKNSFWYTKPSETNLPDSMYKNAIIQNMLNLNWFGSGTFRRASFFAGQTSLPLVTIALILTAVLCAIDEWRTGERVTIPFQRDAYLRHYQKFLRNLTRWKEWSATQQRDLTSELQESLLYNARAASGEGTPTSDDGGDDDEATLLADRKSVV